MDEQPVTPDEEPKEPFAEGQTASRMPWMLGLFDVLGFSDRIASDGAEKVYETYRMLIDRAVQKETQSCIGAMRMPGESGRVPTLFALDVRYAYFSDTIMLWLPLHPMFAGPFLQRCADLVCEGLLAGVPLRGAVSLGEGYMHKRTGIYIGSMVVEAARLEAAQNWIGVGFGPSATWPNFIAEVSPTQIIEYDIPVKPGAEALRSPIALDWPRRWRESEAGSLQDRLRELTPQGRHSVYYEQAAAFARWSEQHHDWHKAPDDRTGFKHLRMILESEVPRPA